MAAQYLDMQSHHMALDFVNTNLCTALLLSSSQCQLQESSSETPGHTTLPAKPNMKKNE